MTPYEVHPTRIPASSNRQNKRKQAGRFIIGDGPRLGKTVATLSAIKDLMYDHFEIARVLVVAPLRVAQEVWSAEIEKWDHTKKLTFSLILGSAKERKAALETEADIYVINRENVVWLIERYGRHADKQRKTGFIFNKPWPFDTIVLDELSSYKNQSTSRFKMMKKVRPYVKRMIGLTGTPAPNGLIDLWSQMYLLDQGERLGKTVSSYRQKYFIPAGYIKNKYGNLVTTKYELRQGAEEEIYAAIGDICISMKSINYLKLPDVFYTNIKVGLDPEESALYLELEKESIIELIDGEIIDAETAASVSSKLHQLAQGAIYNGGEERAWSLVHDEKLDALEELIEEANGQPVIVYYWFKHDLERLKARFKKAKTLDGPKEIHEWNDGKIEILFAHPASAGHGLNLQAGGHLIVWFSLTWSLELYQQANARLNRQGQTQPVTINHIVAKDTIDERILEVLEGKAEKQDALMEAVKASVTKYQN